MSIDINNYLLIIYIILGITQFACIKSIFFSLPVPLSKLFLFSMYVFMKYMVMRCSLVYFTFPSHQICIAVYWGRCGTNQQRSVHKLHHSVVGAKSYEYGTSLRLQPSYKDFNVLNDVFKGAPGCDVFKCATAVFSRQQDSNLSDLSSYRPFLSWANAAPWQLTNETVVELCKIETTCKWLTVGGMQIGIIQTRLLTVHFSSNVTTNAMLSLFLSIHNNS